VGRKSIVSPTFHPFHQCKALPAFFLCLFSSLTCLKKLIFSKQDLLRGRYQLGCTEIFWPAERTGQPVIISKKWKNPWSALPRKTTWLQAVPWFSNYSLRLAGLGHRPQITNHSRACTQALLLYISPIRPARVNQYPHWYLHFLELSLLTSIFNSEIWIKKQSPRQSSMGDI